MTTSELLLPGDPMTLNALRKAGRDAAEMILLLTGAVDGFWAGRWWAEAGRGRYDARRAWRQRRK